jgi:hypothetical protein
MGNRWFSVCVDRKAEGKDDAGAALREATSKKIKMATVNTSSVCIVDFSYYTGIDNRVIVKELAVVKPNKNQQQTWLFEPPYEEDELSAGLQRKNDVRRKKGIQFQWNSGHVPYCYLYEILFKTTRDSEQVAASGMKKCEFISDLIERPVLNLDPLHHQPRLSAERAQSQLYHCILHKNVHATKCPLHRCMTFAALLNKKLQAQQQQQQVNVQQDSRGDDFANNSSSCSGDNAYQDLSFVMPTGVVRGVQHDQVAPAANELSPSTIYVSYEELNSPPDSDDSDDDNKGRGRDEVGVRRPPKLVIDEMGRAFDVCGSTPELRQMAAGVDTMEKMKEIGKKIANYRGYSGKLLVFITCDF